MRALLALSMLCVAGCDQFCDRGSCGACPAAITLSVSRADGADPEGVRVDGAPIACGDAFEGVVTCGASTVPLGTYALVVSADGEDPVELSVSVVSDSGGCCACGQVAVHRDVVLGEPADDDAGAIDDDAGSTDDAGP